MRKNPEMFLTNNDVCQYDTRRAIKKASVWQMILKRGKNYKKATDTQTVIINFFRITSASTQKCGQSPSENNIL